MRLSSLAAVAAVFTMVAVPAFARPANPAAGLTLAPNDGQSGGGSASGAGHHTALIVIGGLVAVGAVAGAAVALGNHHDNKPASS
jgi:hypothetical protein